MPQGSVIGNHHEIELVRPDVRASSLFRSGEPRPVRSLYVLPCTQACRLEREMACFDYGAAAELFPRRQRTRTMGAVTYMRFAASAEAIRYAVEEIPASSFRGTVGLVIRLNGAGVGAKLTKAKQSAH
jgi:hypothetical protein